MAMIKCPECGQEISDKAKKCVHCGKVLIEDKPATKICSECGKENPIDVTECIHCGCPFEEEPVIDTAPIQTAPIERPKKNLKKIIIPIVAAVVVVAIGLIIYNVKVIKPKNAYNEAMTLLEKGKYNEADNMLKDIQGYKDVKKIREEIKYESCAYSAVNAVKDVLKNPDSISVYDIKFYSGIKDAKKDDSVSEDESETEESDSIIDKDHPYIIIHLGAQNGFGGNTESYAICKYSKEEDGYTLDGMTKADNVDDVKDEYDTDDDNYFMYVLSAAIIEGYEKNGEEVGSIDMGRFKTVLKNDAYSTIKIIE